MIKESGLANVADVGMKTLESHEGGLRRSCNRCLGWVSVLLPKLLFWLRILVDTAQRDHKSCSYQAEGHET